MAGNILWQSGNVLSFPMQSSGQGAQVANAVAVGLSGILDNTGASGGPGLFAMAEFKASASGFGAAPVAFGTIDFYLVPARDGVNYMDADTANASLPSNHQKGSFILIHSGNGSPRLGIEGISLLPLKYTGYIKNNTGQTITSGWSLFVDLYDQAYT